MSFLNKDYVPPHWLSTDVRGDQYQSHSKMFTTTLMGSKGTPSQKLQALGQLRHLAKNIGYSDPIEDRMMWNKRVIAGLRYHFRQRPELRNQYIADFEDAVDKLYDQYDSSFPIFGESPIAMANQYILPTPYDPKALKQ